MRIHCPICSTTVEAAEAHIGDEGQCASCGAGFIVPAHPNDRIEIIAPGKLSIMKIDCPVCSTVVRVTEVNIGKKGRCERCSSKFIVPAHPGDEAEILERGRLPMSKIDCPVCSTVVRVSWDNIGEKGRCEGCSSKFIVPAGPGEEIEILERGGVPAGETRHEAEAELASKPVEQ
ncbi:MAG: hypothetical protein VCA55_01360 [Verrucomicrobiales bacterium]